MVRAELPPAQAQTPGERARSADEQARLAAAIDELQRAYQTTGDAEFLFKLGETYRLAGQATNAERTYEAYLRRAPRGPHRAAAEKHLRELDSASPPSAQTAAPAAPARAPTPAPPARPAIPASPARATTPAPPAAPPGAATLPHVSPADSEPPPLRPTGPTPEATSLPRAPESTSSSPPSVTLSAEPAPSGAALPLPAWLPWTAAAATVGLTVAAIVYGTSASSRYNQLRGSCGETALGCTAAQIDDVRGRARTANVLWAAAGIAAVGTGVTVYVNTREAGMSALWRF